MELKYTSPIRVMFVMIATLLALWSLGALDAKFFATEFYASTKDIPYWKIHCLLYFGSGIVVTVLYNVLFLHTPDDKDGEG